MGRPPCGDDTGLKKGPWTPDEDHKLMNYIQNHGHGSWRALAELAGNCSAIHFQISHLIELQPWDGHTAGPRIEAVQADNLQFMQSLLESAAIGNIDLLEGQVPQYQLPGTFFDQPVGNVNLSSDNKAISSEQCNVEGDNSRKKSVLLSENSLPPLTGTSASNP
ncbi:hypothetical protein EJB05_45632, partial [Eragrostis curvula]